MGTIEKSKREERKQRFLELEPTSKQAGVAQKAIALCRMKIQQERAQTG